MCKSQGNIIRRPSFIGERKVQLVDASDETMRGKEKSVWRLHYVFNLFDFEMQRGMEITSNKEGERLTRHEVNARDIMVADRIYCTVSGIEHLLKHGGDYVVRFKSKAFNSYDEDGKLLDLLEYFRNLKALRGYRSAMFLQVKRKTSSNSHSRDEKRH